MLYKIISCIFLNEQNNSVNIISLQSADEQNYTEGIINVCNVIRLVSSIIRAAHQQHPQQTTTYCAGNARVVSANQKLTINNEGWLMGRLDRRLSKGGSRTRA